MVRLRRTLSGVVVVVSAISPVIGTQFLQPVVGGQVPVGETQARAGPEAMIPKPAATPLAIEARKHRPVSTAQRNKQFRKPPAVPAEGWISPSTEAPEGQSGSLVATLNVVRKALRPCLHDDRFDRFTAHGQRKLVSALAVVGRV